MATTITGTEVRYKLRSLTSTDISDTALASAAFIPAADAWENKITGTATLTGDNAALMKAAKISLVAAWVIDEAPVETFKTGPIDSRPVSDADKAGIVKRLLSEVDRFLSILGYKASKGSFYVTSAGGADYHPLLEDYTNVDFTTASEDADYPLRLFP